MGSLGEHWGTGTLPGQYTQFISTLLFIIYQKYRDPIIYISYNIYKLLAIKFNTFSLLFMNIHIAAQYEA